MSYAYNHKTNRYVKVHEGGGVVPRKYARGGIAHPGFKAVQAKIAARQGVSKEEAGAELAASTRHASKAAKKRNPHLKRVKG